MSGLVRFTMLLTTVVVPVPLSLVGFRFRKKNKKSSTKSLFGSPKSQISGWQDKKEPGSTIATSFRMTFYVKNNTFEKRKKRIRDEDGDRGTVCHHLLLIIAVEVEPRNIRYKNQLKSKLKTMALLKVMYAIAIRLQDKIQ
jgi:hypothetical protein